MSVLTAPTVSSQDLPAPALPRSPRYASLDLWRGVACLLVILYHSTTLAPSTPRATNLLEAATDPAYHITGLFSFLVAVTNTLWIGVPMFYVISGYCISAAVDAARRRNSTVGQYFFRRFRRIYPPFWALCGVAALGVVSLEYFIPGIYSGNVHPIHNPAGLSLPQWLGNLTLTETWRYHLAGGPALFFMGHAWTLCYEEQFYAISGLVLALAPQRFFTMSVLISIATVLCMHLLPRFGLDIDGFFFAGYWLMFAAGVLVYYQTNYAGPGQRWLCYAVLLLGILYAGRHPSELVIALRSPSMNISLLTSFLFAGLLCLLRRHDQIMTSARIFKPLIFCGVMCYSMYLVHWPIVRGLIGALYLLGIRSDRAIILTAIPLSLALAIPAAWLFHVTVERRFLNSQQPR